MVIYSTWCTRRHSDTYGIGQVSQLSCTLLSSMSPNETYFLEGRFMAQVWVDIQWLVNQWYCFLFTHVLDRLCLDLTKVGWLFISGNSGTTKLALAIRLVVYSWPTDQSFTFPTESLLCLPFIQVMYTQDPCTTGTRSNIYSWGWAWGDCGHH